MHIGSDAMWTRVREFGVWFVTGFVTGSVVWVVAPSLILGLHPTVVTSGSMTPAVRVGDVVLIDRDPGERIPGEVIQFEDSAGELTLHRIVGVGDGGYQTRGDANGSPDGPPVTPDRVQGRAVMLVPYVAHPAVIAAAALAFVTIVLVALAKRHRRSRGSRPPVLAGCFFVAVALVIGVAATPASTAQFLDTTPSAANRMEALTIAPPTNLTATCPLVNLGPVRLAWTASPTAGVTAYEILYRSTSPTFSVIATVPATQTTFEHPGVSGIIATHRYMVRAKAGPWISAPSNEDSITVLLFLVCVNN